MRHRKSLAFVCVCVVLLAVAGASFGFATRGAHAGSRPGNLTIGSGDIGSPVCYQWAAYGGPNQGAGNNTLNAVATVPNSVQVWAVGEYYNTTAGYWQTLIERFDGTRWSIVSSPYVPSSDNYLTGITIVSASDIWVVGYAIEAGTSDYQTLIERWNGTSWSIVASPSVPQTSNFLYGVAAVSANDVWAVGAYFDNATMRYHTLTQRWSGSAWSIVSSPNGNMPGPKSGLPGNNWLVGVAAVSANDIWAVGWDTSITLAEHWNGSSWNIIPTPNGSAGGGFLQSVAALSSTNVMAVGFTYAGSNVPLAERWNGSTWSIVLTPNPTTTNNNVLNTISAVPGTQTYIAAGQATAQGGIATRGGTRSGSRSGPYSSTTTSKTLMESWNGAAWKLLSTPNLSSSANSVNGISAASATNIWAVGAYQVTTSASTLIMRSIPNGMGIACM
ncbi:MAG TPA: hypothetical protein VKQ30_10445 [Ktedonobacterales bacterium]|nr:hypothetical protein [Ktedonobacterales bacterium]